jgi:hypothetical protein
MFDVETKRTGVNHGEKTVCENVVVILSPFKVSNITF